MKKEQRVERRTSLGPLTLSLLAGLALAGCKGDDGDPGPPGPPGGSGGTPTEVARGQAPPGVNVTVLGLRGATGPSGNFRAGDRITIDYRVQKDDGSDWDVTEFSRGRALVSGPSFNYNRVLPEVTDVPTASVQKADGSYSYTFASPIPAVYAAPFNDTASFGTLEGELTGQPLLDGTYTVGLYFRWDFTVGEENKREAGNAELDFLYGGATTIAHREMVLQANCNRCHSDLQAHGGMRKDVSLCILCHTSGSEDSNSGGATPGVTIDFRVMIHKIHNAEHLPSVLGVATKSDGSRDYGATPASYVVAGHDYSDVGFPVFPNLAIGVARDVGWSALPAAARAQEDVIRTGVTDCSVCHGDPDGAGPLAAPAQGGLAFSQPSRRACGACHDDINWAFPYSANMQTMPAQNDDASCKLCHDPSGNDLAVMDAHLHPLLDPLVNPGLNFAVTTVEEGPGADMDGKLEVGERIALTLTLQDDQGADVDASTISSRNLVIAGPTANSNLLLSTSIPAEALTGPQPYVIDVPQQVDYEFLGDSDGGTNDEVFTTRFSPHWNGATSPTTVYRRMSKGTATFLTSAAEPFQNFIEVDGTAGFAANQVIVLDDAAPMREEYLRIQWVDVARSRLWFSSPAQSGYPFAVRGAHDAGTTVEVANLTPLSEGMDYDLTASTGEIQETPEFGDAAIVASYTADYELPDLYGTALNDSPDLGETSGKWTGKPLVAGTYTATVWGSRGLSVAVGAPPLTETTTYNGTSPPATRDFLVGDATTLEPYDLISGAQNCYRCHQDLWFHGGGRRGFMTCVACHGTAGAEDRPQYRAWGAPATTRVQISFREMLHKIHMGEELANASSYTVVGFGAGGPPNNFTPHQYAEVVFPPLPGGARNCEVCHGTSDAWESPSLRDHPTDQGMAVRAWTIVCNACHDSAAATGHINSQVGLGIEGCAVCHGPGKEWNVQKMHRAY